jgi:hypothetical protein
MFNYEIVDDYKIKEIMTDIIIHIDTNKKKTKKLVNKLNTGTGFSGNTPPFFSNTYKIAK